MVAGQVDRVSDEPIDSDPAAWRARYPFAVYIVNLDRSIDRWRNVTAALPDLAPGIQRVRALDAATDPVGVCAVRGLSVLRPGALGWNRLRGRAYTLVEEGCFASHIVTLRRFLASTFEFALVLEDDAVPLRPPREEIMTIIAAGGFDVVKLEGLKRHGRRLGVFASQLGSASRLVRSLHPASGSAAYLVSRRGAELLLAGTGQLLVPYDDYLNNPGLHHCRLMHVSPWLFAQTEAGASTIAARRTAIQGTPGPGRMAGTLANLRRARLRLALWLAVLAAYRPTSHPLKRAPW